MNILSSELADDFVCAAIPHPSLDLEEKMYGGSLPDLMSRINRPVLLMPTKVFFFFLITVDFLTFHRVILRATKHL